MSQGLCGKADRRGNESGRMECTVALQDTSVTWSCRLRNQIHDNTCSTIKISVWQQQACGYGNDTSVQQSACLSCIIVVT